MVTTTPHYSQVDESLGGATTVCRTCDGSNAICAGCEGPLSIQFPQHGGVCPHCREPVGSPPPFCPDPLCDNGRIPRYPICPGDDTDKGRVAVVHHDDDLVHLVGWSVRADALTLITPADNAYTRRMAELEPICDNCGGQKCMGCVLREYNHDCADDCPECCRVAS